MWYVEIEGDRMRMWLAAHVDWSVTPPVVCDEPPTALMKAMAAAVHDGFRADDDDPDSEWIVRVPIERISNLDLVRQAVESPLPKFGTGTGVVRRIVVDWRDATFRVFASIPGATDPHAAYCDVTDVGNHHGAQRVLLELQRRINAAVAGLELA